MVRPKTETKPVSTGSGIRLGDIFSRMLQNWPWTLLSVALCIAAGTAYLLVTPNEYTETAAILIKDDGKGKTTATQMNDFGDLGLFQSNTNIQNEMSTLASPDLMEEVVRRLSLYMNYWTPGRFHKTVAYGSGLPVKVALPDCPVNVAVKFDLDVRGDGSYVISGLEDSEGTEGGKDFSGRFNDTLRTPVGKIVVTPSPYWSKGDAARLKVAKSTMANAIASYESRLRVTMSNEKSSIINLSFTDQNIQRGDEVLNTIIGIYNENWIRDKNQIAVSTSNFINDRLGIIEGELGNVDSDISSYKSANLVPDVDAAASSYLAETQNLSQEILGLNNQLRMTRYIRGYLTSDATNDKVLPANSGLDNLNIQGQITDYNEKLLQRNDLASKSSEKNPLVKNMDQELQEMRNAIIGSVDNSILNLQTQVKGLQGARGAATSKLASNPTQAKYLLSVERQQKVKESLYLFLLQKREDNELSQAFTAYNTRVIKRPGGTGIPSSPNKRNILLCCFLIGLVIPFGVIYGKETSNTHVRGRQDVKRLTVPMLGEIPEDRSLDRSKDKESHSILVKSGSRDITNEAFRVLRTNVDFMRINKEGCDVIAITSFNPGSGKSFIAANLASSLALRDERVLLIDGDLRRGTTSAYAGNPKKGLSDYLAGNVSDAEALMTAMPGLPALRVLPIGSIPPNPTELIETKRFSQLVESLRKDYDYIVIDCPPIEVVADAQIIDRVTDRTVFVLRAGLFEREMLPEFESLYQEKKYHNMAFILNGTEERGGKYGYAGKNRYGYGYGYAYGHGYYGSKAGGKKKK